MRTFLKNSLALLALAVTGQFFSLAQAQQPAASGNTAFMRITAGSGVTATEIETIDRHIRSAVSDYGSSLVDRQTVSSKLGKPHPLITDFCEENDLICYAETADKIGVKYLLIGVVERADQQRLAIELKLFEKAASATPGGKSTGAITKNELQYFTGGKGETLDKTCRYIVGKLLSRNGYLAVSTNVQGADIIVNGRKMATFPLSQPLVLPQGHHTIVLHKDGYDDFQGSVDITVEETTAFKGALKPQPFKLSIDSVPSNASVFLGESNIGYTPLTNYDVLNFAKTPLRLQYNQYFEFKQEIEVVPGGRYQNSVTLKPQFGDLLVVSEALDAKVLLDGKFVGNTPIQLLEKIPMGEHTIELVNVNYFPFKQKITIIPGEKNQFNLNPKARYAFLSITTNVDRAGIFLNDQFIGYSPYDNFVRLKPGTYKLRLNKQNYFDYTGEIDLQPGKRINYAGDLKTQLASFALSSNVSGAKVYLNDRFLGETPLKPIETLPLGEYKLVLTKQSYFDYNKVVSIKPGRVNNHFAEMITTLGKLAVDCPVKEVQIFLGDRLLGMTPAPIFEGIQPGTYTIRLNKEGYEPYNGSVTIKSNEIVRYNAANLIRTSSGLQVTSTPSGASVLVNGRLMGVTPANLTVKTGEYTVEVKLRGYRDYRTKINISADRPSTIQTSLTPKPFELVVDVSEKGANVELDGSSIGASPIRGYRGSIFGQHTLRVTKAGFKPVERTINLLPGTRTKVNVNLYKN